MHMVLCDDALLSCVWSGGDRVVPCWNGTCQAALCRVLSFPLQFASGGTQAENLKPSCTL